MEAVKQGQVTIDLTVPDYECKFFKISAPTNSRSETWTLSTLANTGTALSNSDFRVAFAGDDKSAAAQEKRIAESNADCDRVEIKRKSGRILFCDREIILQCAPGDLETRLANLQDFCSLFARTMDLEKRTDRLLKTARQDTAFTGQVTPQSLSKFADLDEKNRAAVLARIEYVEILRAKARAEESTDEDHLFAGLLDESGLNEILERLDNEIEVAAEVYSVCIDRLSEFSYFWREYKAELWIIVILVFELLAFFVDLWLQVNPLHS